jgi:hypothetical protein
MFEGEFGWREDTVLVICDPDREKGDNVGKPNFALQSKIVSKNDFFFKIEILLEMSSILIREPTEWVFER